MARRQKLRAASHEDLKFQIEDFSGARQLIPQSAISNLQSEISFHYRRFLGRRALVIGVDLAVLVGIERAMLGVELLGRQSEVVPVFVRPKAYRIIASLRIYHALG